MTSRGDSLDRAPLWPLLLIGPNREDRRRWAFTDVAFTPDGRQLVGVAMTTIVVWDTTSGGLRDYIDRGSGGGDDKLTVAPDGRSVAVLYVELPGIFDLIPPPPP